MRGAPQRELALRHRANQRADVRRHRRPSYAAPALPSPPQSKAPSVPGDDGVPTRKSNSAQSGHSAPYLKAKRAVDPLPVGRRRRRRARRPCSVVKSNDVRVVGMVATFIEGRTASALSWMQNVPCRRWVRLVRVEPAARRAFRPHAVRTDGGGLRPRGSPRCRHHRAA